MNMAQALEACSGLRAGLGVEDIAVRLGVPVGVVRDLVAALRARGLLREVIFGLSAGARA